MALIVLQRAIRYTEVVDEGPPTTTAQLALGVMRQQADAVAEHAPQAHLDSDPEHIHQTRVATRRMRAALRVFEGVLPVDADCLKADLAWLASLLGPARDLDVQVLRLAANGTELGLACELVPFGAWLEDQRQRALATMEEAFASERFGAVLDHLASLQRLEVDPERDTPLDEDAPRRLRRGYRPVRKTARRLRPDAPASDFHQVRIRAKRLRYAVEFYTPIYRKPARRVVARATALQDLLGDHQDGVVNAQHIHEAMQTAGATWPAETALALGQVLQHEAQHGADIRGQVPAAYAEVRDAWRRLKRTF